MTFSHFFIEAKFFFRVSTATILRVKQKIHTKTFNCEQSDQDTPHKEGTPFDLFHNTGEQQKAYI